MNVINHNKNMAEGLALILILYSNVCFYNLDTQLIYITMNAVAGGIIVIKHFSVTMRVAKPVVWLSVLFIIFILYGLLYNQTGIFNIDRYVISYAQCILYYIIFKSIIHSDDYEKKLAYFFSMAAFLCIFTMYVKEGDFLGRELRSVGSTMSGNVNTVGMSLGIMSLFMTYYFGKSRKKTILFLSIFVMAIMMLTGSKKTIVYIIANIFVIYSFSKNKTTGKIVLISLASILAYLIFGVEYFYDMLGKRIIDMLGQMGIKIPSADYSRSTETRMYMIKEGFNFWLRNPIWGGGANYFHANTITEYEYSHCNVAEVLCTYGILGFLIFYYPHISYIASYKKIKAIANDKHIVSFGLILVITSLIIDWMAVTFSSFSTVYIPIIFTIVIKDKIKDRICFDSYSLIGVKI